MMKVELDVKIDPHKLDWEFERQPELMQTYTEKLALAIKQLSELKLVLDGMISEQKIEWRADGEIIVNGAKVRITEGALDNAIDAMEDIQDKRKEIINKTYEVDLLKGVVEALRHKKSALEKEVDLYIAGYYSSPKDQRTLLNEKK